MDSSAAGQPGESGGANRPLIGLAGPTAVGKSAVALVLAEAIGGEIISVDSMQVYRGLDIGTAKPSYADRERVPHHLVDIVGLETGFDAAQFCEHASRAIAEIQSRGKRPILCGGTGLYFKALLGGLSRTPPTDAALRAEIEAMPREEMLAELEQTDPETYARIDRHNTRRLIRAIEVIRLTGKPYSGQRVAWPAPSAMRAGARLFGLRRSSTDLAARIERRVDEMFAQGLVTETSALLDHGLAGNRTAMQALGYRQVIEYLRGERSLADTITLVKSRTRQFARRQMTWFRGQLELRWFELTAAHAPEETAREIAALAEVEAPVPELGPASEI